MGEHKKQPFEAEATDQTQSKKDGGPALATAASEDAGSERPDCNWEGYKPEILSVWFDP